MELNYIFLSEWHFLARVGPGDGPFVSCFWQKWALCLISSDLGQSRIHCMLSQTNGIASNGRAVHLTGGRLRYEVQQRMKEQLQVLQRKKKKRTAAVGLTCWEPSLAVQSSLPLSSLANIEHIQILPSGIKSLKLKVHKEFLKLNKQKWSFSNYGSQSTGNK